MGTDIHKSLDDAVRTGSTITCTADLVPPTPHTPIAGPTYPAAGSTGSTYQLFGRKATGPGEDPHYEYAEVNSVAAEANLWEQSILEAHRSKEPALFFPLIEADLTDVVPGLDVKISSLDAPHGIADARLRDCLLEGVPLRESEVGRAIFDSNPSNMTALFRYSVATIVVGGWDTHAPRLEAKQRFNTNRQLRLRRVITAEIVGRDVIERKRRYTVGDPLHFSKDLKLQATHGYYKDFKVEAGKGEAASMGLSAVTSGKDKESEACGGLMVKTIQYTANVALPVLRQYRFPVDGEDSADRDHAARKVVAALSILGLTLRFERGFCLRSNCDLTPEGPALWSFYGRTRQDVLFEGTLSKGQAYSMYERAYREAQEHGLVWEDRVFRLEPSEPLRAAIARNYEMSEKS